PRSEGQVARPMAEGGSARILQDSAPNVVGRSGRTPGPAWCAITRKMQSWRNAAKNPAMCLKSGHFSVMSLRDGRASGYSLGAPPLAEPAAKEALSEGAGQLPISEPVFGFSRGNLRRASARVPEGGRKPRSAPAAFQDHRRKGHRRSAHHFGRLPA